MQKPGLCLVGVVALLAVSGCQRPGGGREFRVGVIAPLAGPGAVWGQWLKEGIDTALAARGAEGVRITYEDSGGVPARALSAARKLIDVDHVQAVYGPLSTAEVLAVAPVTEAAKVVLLTPSASGKAISSAGAYVFRTYPNDQQQSDALARFVVGVLRAERVAVVYRLDDFGVGVERDFAAALTVAGIKGYVKEGFEPQADDFRALLTKVKNAAPAVTLIVGMPRDLGLLLRQSREVQLATQFMSTANIESPEVLKLAGAAAEGVIYATVYFDPSSSAPSVVEFQARYRAVTKKDGDAGLGVAAAYDGMAVLLEAIKAAKAPTGDALKDALYGLKGFSGVTGEVRFDANGDVSKPFALKTIRNGRFELYRDRLE
jgi:branched-chain amino acid transport system substrate-binding protein